MRKDIVVIGVGGTSRDILEALEATNEAEATWNILGFLDDNPALRGQEVFGYCVLGASDTLLRPEFAHANVVIGVANDRQLLIRRRIRDHLGIGPERYPVIAHPAAVISPRASIGAGSAILSGSYCAGKACFGAHVIVLHNSTIGHGAEIADFVSVSSGVSMGGGVRIGEGAYVGLGSTLLPGVQIGRQSRVGMGAVVIRDVPDYATVVGNPARILNASIPAVTDVPSCPEDQRKG
jgi:sugar O-acyltransferase (sialic acid O-acetyltransferase NeuD family)